MASEIYFLTPKTAVNYTPNFAEATGSLIFLEYSQGASDVLTSTQTESLVSGGVVTAIARAEGFFSNDANFSELFIFSEVVGEEGDFQGQAKSETQIVAEFAIPAGESFSFSFLSDLSLEAKEIENPDAEYNKAVWKNSFAVLDVTHPDSPELIDYYGDKGRLVSSKPIAKVKDTASGSVSFSVSNRTIELGGNNGTDSIFNTAIGSYERYFAEDTKLAIVEISENVVKIAGDTLIGNLGDGVLYGTIRSDQLSGSDGDDKIYGSLGRDRILGKQGDDIIEGGGGRDVLKGNAGNDKLSGGFDNDRLKGGAGNDTLVGGSGDDILVGKRGDDRLTGNEGNDDFRFQASKPFTSKRIGIDTITDFEVGRDSIVLGKKLFTALTSEAEKAIAADEFAVVANDAAAATSEALITYIQAKGGLFYNQNGSDPGLGSGALFATLAGNPTLNAGDIEII